MHRYYSGRRSGQPQSGAEGAANAAILVVARCNNQIIAVGAIKRLRAEYAAGIARKSGAEFPAETPELGYVAIYPAHQRRGLSHRLVQLLLLGRKDRLFATTSAAPMKKVLARAGFTKKQMTGRANILNYLVGSGNTPVLINVITTNIKDVMLVSVWPGPYRRAT